MEGDYSGSGVNQTPKAGLKNKTGDFICCVCGDKATNYRSVRLKLRKFILQKYKFSDFTELRLSAILAEFSSGEL